MVHLSGKHTGSSFNTNPFHTFTLNAIKQEEINFTQVRFANLQQALRTRHKQKDAGDINRKRKQSL